MKNDKYFRTTNLNLAIFLLVSDQQISGINPLNKDQKEFAFVKSDCLNALAHVYKFGDKNDGYLLVNIHKYEQARRDLLDRLND